MHNLKAAVVGAGFIGPVHVEALRRLGIGVTGILGCDRAESESAKEALGLPKAYESLDDVLADAAVDSVHLAVPNVLHYEFAKKALQAGKHVMCEKPLAMNSTESAELVELAKSKGVAAGVCYNLRFYPLNLEARDMAARGDLGDVYAINGSYVQDWLFYDTDYNWRVLADQGGLLRAVADIGTHWMDLVLSITGLEIEAVFADLVTVHPIRNRPTGEVETFTGKTAEQVQTEPVEVTTEDYGCMMFRFRGGGRGSMYVSQVTAGRKNCLRWEISGSKCALAFDSESPNQLWIGHRDRPNEVMLRDPALVGDMARGFVNYPGGHNEGFPDAFKQCFRAFYAAVAAGNVGEFMYPTFEEGHREVVLCEAILESHQKQQWVTL
ncbi:MAG: Gfo/Idh/MocA family oxidoreductase [Candidatus Nealsonbacteria bacterium]|nr:Gfo/Idh/MocA family oxidoreductase [Candidatus Nealsonbacteria bacterium]